MSARHLHIDPVGGIAGDMFAAAMLDAFPALGDGLVDALRKAGLASDVVVKWERVTEEVLAGTRFVVDDPRERKGPRPPYAALAPAHAQHAHHGNHEHVRFIELRDRIVASGLEKNVIDRAIDIFTRVARAEAEVHGFADIDAVVLHEVGAMDSVADIVAAAWLIENAHATWSCASLPLGSGTVTTAHGVLPIPAPATAILLRGLPVHDDGRPGERVTPTGAAIVASLLDGVARVARPRGTLRATGTGWGTKRFAGLPNVVRVLEIVSDGPVDAVQRDIVSALSFEIDDQPAEDLAIALDHLRATDGVLDVLQAPAFGKKGRMVAQVRVLARANVERDVVDACLRETTTLGVRIERVERAVLAREELVRDVDGARVRVKRAQRPDGATCKSESDDVAALPSAAQRARAKRKAEDT